MNLLLVDAGKLINGVISDVGTQSYGYDFADRLTLQTSGTLTGLQRTDRTVVYDALAGMQKEARYDYGSAVGTPRPTSATTPRRSSTAQTKPDRA